MAEIADEKLFYVDPRSLDPDVELGRYLGNIFHNQRQTVRGTAQHSSYRPRRSKIVVVKESWPILRQQGLYMVLDNEESGVKWYRFVHSSQYREVQQNFWLHQGQIDHESIFNLILPTRPYHLDSLLVFNEVMQFQEDYQIARDSLERGLFACESSFHHTFQLLSLKHCLSYQWCENRAFFLLLFRRLLQCAKRRCFQTAFQFTKIIFMKDPSDPFALLLLIDSLALKAREYDFLVRFYQRFRQERNLDFMPNFLYSLALSFHQKSILSTDEQMRNENDKEAKNFLGMAILRFPFVLSRILERIQIFPEETIRNDYYMRASAIERETPGLKVVVEVYIKHSIELWENRDILPWLEQTTREIYVSFPNHKAELNEWTIKRKSVFIGLPRGILRHCQMNSIRIDHLFDISKLDLGDLVTDPCPPLNTRREYEKIDFMAESAAAQAVIIPQGQQPLTFKTIIFSFIRSLSTQYQRDILSALFQFMAQKMTRIRTFFQRIR